MRRSSHRQRWRPNRRKKRIHPKKKRYLLLKMTPSNWPAKARATNRSNTFHIHTGPRRAGTSHLNILGGRRKTANVMKERQLIFNSIIKERKTACYCKCHTQLFILSYLHTGVLLSSLYSIWTRKLDFQGPEWLDRAQRRRSVSTYTHGWWMMWGLCCECVKRGFDLSPIEWAWSTLNLQKV